MANTFADELKWWNKRAASYQTKRANIRPVSFEYLSKAYSSAGSLNGGYNFDSASTELARFQSDFQRLSPMDPTKVTGAAKTKTPLAPLSASIAKPSQDVLKLDKQVNTTEAKLKALGSNAFRTVVGGLIRVADVISRPGFAMRSGALHYANENAAPGSDGGTDTTFGEHVENVLRPAFDILTMPRQLLGEQNSNTVYTDMNKGWQGKAKTSGSDILKVTFPEFTSDHKKWTSVLGFGVDVLYDPLTWVTVGEGTIVTGTAKGLAAGGARMAGKHTLAEGMLSNTLWSKSGRQAGIKALEQSINMRAAKPITKELHKLDKPLKPYVKAARKADRKGDEVASAAAKAEHSKLYQANEAVRSQLIADRDEVLRQTYNGIQLAYKSVATKTLGLSSIGQFNRGVRSGGLHNKSVKQLQTAFKMNREAAAAKFKNIDSPESYDMRITHAHIAGDTIKFKNKGVTKEFKVAEDYDDFVDEFLDGILPSTPVTEMTSKAKNARKGTLSMDDTTAKELFNKVMLHAHYKASAEISNIKNLKVVGPASKAADVAEKVSMESLVKATAAARVARDAATTGADTAAEALAAARIAQVEARNARDVAVKARQAAAVEADLIDAEVDAALTRMGVALSKRNEVRATSEASRAPEQLMDDVQRGIDTQAAHIRDSLLARQVVDEFNTQARPRLDAIEGVTTTDTAEGFAIVPPVVKNPDAVQFNRAKNLAIAQAIEEAHKFATSVAVNTILDEDPELAMVAMQGATAHILNMLTADTHLQVGQYLSAKHGLGYLPMAPSTNLVSPVTGGILWNDPFVYRNAQGVDKTIDPAVMKKGATARVQFELDTSIKGLLTVDGLQNTISPVPLERYAAEFDAATPRGFETYIKKVINHYTNYRHDGPRFSEVAAHGMSLTKSMQEAVETLVQKGGTLLFREYNHARTSISEYTMLDYWMYTDSVFDELKLTDTAVGRLAHVTAMPPNPTSIEAIAKAVESIPEVDAELVAAIKVIKAEISDAKISATQRNEINRIIGRLIAPDISRITNKSMNTADIDIDKAMESLGTHLWVLSNTNIQKGPAFSIAFRTALAERIWQIPALMQQLNQSIMLGTLHHVYANKLTHEQAADKIADFFMRYDGVHNLLRQANEAGVTTGNVGVRPPVRSAAGPNLAEAATDTPEMQGLSDKVDLAQGTLATAKATEKSANEALVKADQVVTREESAVSDAAKTLEQSEAELAGLETKKAALEANATADPAAIGNAPGGHSAPDTLEPEVIVQAEAAIGAMSSNIDIARINEAISKTNTALTMDMAEYALRMGAMTQNMDLRVGRTLRFAGLPIAPLPSFNNPMHSYAGVVAMKESQGRVANWANVHWDPTIDKSAAIQNRFFKRPSTFEATVNDMRRTSSNNAQNRINAMAIAIHQAFKAYKNKAELRADVKSYFDTSIPDIGVKLAPTADRFQMVQNHFETMARARSGNNTMDPDTLRKLAGEFNESLPKEFKFPEEIFDNNSSLKFETNDSPFSREWLAGLSKHLDASIKHTTHPMAIKNVAKFDMAGFDFATQHALSKIELRDELHISMYDHFSFEASPDQIAVWNKSLPEDQHYVLLGDAMGSHAMSFGGKGYEKRYVSSAMGDEMRKISMFVDGSTNYKMGDLNFGGLAKINNYWKAMVTTWNVPKYHIANIMSDSFLSAIDGTRLGHYEKAMIVMTNSHELSGRIKLDPVGYQKLMKPDLAMIDVGNPRDLEKAIATAGDATRAKTVTTITVDGRAVRLSAEDIYKLYVDYGLSQNQVNGNILRSASMHGNSKASDAASQISNKVLDLSQGREDYFRLAHFIHALENESAVGVRSLHDVTKAARDRIIKYHFDYGDVTEFERLWVGRYMPFYKWTRNIVPLAVSQLFTNPKAYTIPNAMNATMGEMFFPTQETPEGEEIPASYITPSWVADAHMVPIGVYTDPDGNEQARYAVLNLPLEQTLAQWIMPFMDPMFDPTKSKVAATNEGTGNTVATMLSATNPFIKAIMQLGLGVTAVPGDTFKAKPYDWLKTLGGVAFPASGMLMQMQKDAKTGVPMGDLGGILDNTGVIRQTPQTEASTKGTLREQQDRLTAILRAPETKWIQQNYPTVDPESDEGRKLIHKYYVDRGILQK